ncbi:MAG TPA: hypothetical protein VGM56_12900 [Byssovorax sp.]|jgi:hypothetical protein
MDNQQLQELILQSLEHEMGGVKVYTTALTCVLEDDLDEEWQKYLAQTKTHVEALREMCALLGIDAAAESPGRAVVRGVGAALVEAMKKALDAGDEGAAQLVACECVVLAETKDHLDWELLAKCADHVPRDVKKQIHEIVQRVEDEEDEHLYHTRGWCRELWIRSLGLKAVLPPPEEKKKVKTAIGAARAEQSAGEHR